MEDKTLKYKEVICKHIFDDNFDNVIKNLKIINYAYQNNLINRKEEYKPLIEMFAILNTNNLEIIKAFEPKQILTENLYNAYKEVQYKSFENIKSSLYNFKEEDINLNLSNNEVKVFNIKTNEEKLLISTSRFLKNENNDLSKINQNINFRNNRKISQDFKSLSFINNKNIKTYRDLSKYVTFVYPNDIPNEYLISITSEDAWVDFNKEGLPASKSKPFYKENEKLLDSTTHFNEISILRNDNFIEDYNSKFNSTVRPTALFCIGEITPIEYKIAKELNIDIIFSESKYKYNSKVENLPKKEDYFK